MKTALLLISSLVVSVWFLSGCATSTETTTADELPTYQCPECTETVTWARKGPRFSKLSSRRRNVKTVTHQCPNCKKTWGANLSVGSTCETCQEKHLECPACKKHG